MSTLDPDALLLSLARALHGQVGPALRAVSVTERDRRISLQFHIDGPISMADQQSASEVGAAVAADFPSASVAEDLIRRDAPAPALIEDGWALAYRRREPET